MRRKPTIHTSWEPLASYQLLERRYAPNSEYLMLVLHAAHFANRQPFASGLQLGFAKVFAFAGLQAFGSAFMGCCHRSVARNILLAFFITVFICSKSEQAA
jgi:hypothetical protein